MGGNKESGLKAAKTNTKNNPNYYAEMGALGGKTITENTSKRGFGSMSIERRREVARKGAMTRLENMRLKNGA